MNSVTFIVGQLILGGAEKQLYLLSKGLILRGWKVSVITLHGGCGDYWEKPIRKLGIELLEVKTSNRLEAIRQIFTFIKHHPTDVIHSWSSFTSLYALLVSYLTNTPICVGSQRSSEQNTIHDLGFILYWLSYWGFKGITVNSHFGMKELGNRWPKKEICYIPNGVEIPGFSKLVNLKRKKSLRERFNIPQDLLVIGSVGRLTQVKRFDLLIESIQMIQGNNFKCGLVIIGDGPLKFFLSDKADNSLQKGTFFFLGSLYKAEEYMPIFDIFCLTSDYEGTPNVLLEALALGLPVISTKVGDVEEIIENEKSGVLLPSNDPDIISHHIQEILLNPNLCKDYSKNGKEKILDQYDASKAVDLLINFYNQLSSNMNNKKVH